MTVTVLDNTKLPHFTGTKVEILVLPPRFSDERRRTSDCSSRTDIPENSAGARTGRWSHFCNSSDFACLLACYYVLFREALAIYEKQIPR